MAVPTPEKAAGNWRDFDSFVWFRQSELKNPEEWAIFYTHNRDSGLLTQSNASVITKEMTKFSKGRYPEVFFESHSHFACGYVDGFSIRAYKKGKVTKAFLKYQELCQQLDDYPILDEEDHSRREYEATLANIRQEGKWLAGKEDYILPENWEDTVYSWLSDNDCHSVENSDDQGGYPDEDALRKAFEALKFKKEAE